MNIRFLNFIRALLLTVILGAVAFQIAHVSAFSESITPTANHQTITLKPIAREEPTSQETDIFVLVNHQRKIHKRRKLKWNRKLAKIARYYSRKMATENFFDHYDPAGGTLLDRAKLFRLKGWRRVGENLFFSEGYISPIDEAVDGWLESPGHKMNMLDKDWTHSAIGVYEARGMKTYVTQVFMRK